MRRHLQGRYSRQIQLISSEVHAGFFCVVATHKSQKTLRKILHFCVFFTRGVAYFLAM